MKYWFISRCIDPKYLEEFIGDLDEIYMDRVSHRGKFIARIMYVIDYFHLLFGFSSSKLFKFKSRNILMKSMLKMALRSAMKQKQFTLLNLLGLTLGISVSITVGLYVYEELSFDEFHVNKDRIYRVNQPNIWDNWGEMMSTTGPNVATAMKEDLPEFEEVTRILSMGSQFVTQPSENKKNSFKEDQLFAVDSNFFNVFTFEAIHGNPTSALTDPRNLILTEETSIKYFGDVNSIGKSLHVKDWDGTWNTFTVKAILANIPKHSHLQFDMLTPVSSFQEFYDFHSWKWIWTAFSTYGLVHENTDLADLTDKLQKLPSKWAPPTTERIFNQTFEEFTAGNPWTLTLQPIEEIYLSDNPDNNAFGDSGNFLLVKVFAMVGVLVLILSCINFMNLYTAKAAIRTKEVGIRKVLGSTRMPIISQFILEAILFVALSTSLALLVTGGLMDWFNFIAGKSIQFEVYLMNPAFLMIIGLFVIGLGIAAGSYPALYLSGFRPIQVLKGKLGTGFKGKSLRNSLVVLQFSLSIALLICTFFVQKQLKFTSNMEIGISDSPIIQVHNIEQLGFDTEALKNSFSAVADIEAVGKSFGVPPNVWTSDRYKAKGPDSEVVLLSNLRTEGDYLDLLELEFLAGRNFQNSRETDKYKVILNEEAVKSLGWGEASSYDSDSPIGKSIQLASGDEDEFEVIGVVKDFNFNAVRINIQPLIIIHQQNDKVWDYGAGLSFYSLKINENSVVNADDLERIIDKVNAIMTETDASIPFEYSFLDQEFENEFRNERQMGTVLNVVTFIAIVIACLGLYGLSAFSAEQRTKELSIRKVMGARTLQLAVIFSSEFSKLILLAIFIALPISYLSVDYWLAQFAYRTPIEWWVFATATISALFIAIATLSYQSISAANKNPVDTLKEN